MRQYLLDLSLEEMSIDLLLQGDFKGREKGIKETPFSIAKKKKQQLWFHPIFRNFYFHFVCWCYLEKQ